MLAEPPNTNCSPFFRPRGAIVKSKQRLASRATREGWPSVERQARPETAVGIHRAAHACSKTDDTDKTEYRPNPSLRHACRRTSEGSSSGRPWSLSIMGILTRSPETTRWDMPDLKLTPQIASMEWRRWTRGAGPLMVFGSPHHEIRPIRMVLDSPVLRLSPIPPRRGQPDATNNLLFCAQYRTGVQNAL